MLRFSALLAVLAAVGACSTVRAAESYDNCTGYVTSVPAVIGQAGTWCLDRNLQTSDIGVIAIDIQADNSFMSDSSPRPETRSARPATVRPAEADRGRALVLCLAAWLVPGAGHLLQHRMGRGLVFLFVLPLMFALGLLFDGALFPLTPITQSPLTSAAALAERCIGAPWIATAVAGWGRGDVVSPTYEYGWVLMVVAGLLNTLVVLDAYDIALGRK